jgi:hypothetical protein
MRAMSGAMPGNLASDCCFRPELDTRQPRHLPSPFIEIRQRSLLGKGGREVRPNAGRPGRLLRRHRSRSRHRPVAKAVLVLNRLALVGDGLRRVDGRTEV